MSAPATCSVSFTAYDAKLNPLPGIGFSFLAVSAATGAGSVLSNSTQDVVTDDSGQVVISLIQGVCYEVHGPAGRPFTIDVPSQPSYTLPNVQL